jgi:hypothetical protein
MTIVSTGTTPASTSIAASTTAASTTASATSLPAQWQDWIANNIVQGCIDIDMVKVMVENGFDPVFSAHVLCAP